MNIIVVEDDLYRNFLPLTWSRPVWELRVGATTILERLKRKYPKAKLFFRERDYLLPGQHPVEKGQELNGRVIPSSGRELAYPWDLIKYLADDLEEDLKAWGGRGWGKIHQSVTIYNKGSVRVEKGAEVEANCVLDARGGPIYIAPGTIIRPLSYLRGPLSIGPNCRIGGEVTHSIFHGHANKAHYGFIGHSYVGEWANLGAGTTNSNLKNTYGTVKVTLNGQQIDSGEQFLGCLVGDHAKFGIGSLVNTGTVVGFGANVLGGKLTPKVIPDFSWDGEQPYRLKEFLKVAKQVMARRHVELDEAAAEKLKKIYALAIR